MASPLCGTGLYANDVLCEVINKLDNLNDLALTLKDEALSAINDLKLASETALDTINAIDYTVDTAGVNKTYVPPTPPTLEDFSTLGPTPPTFPDPPTIEEFVGVDTPPTVPAAYTVPDATTTALISDAAIESIFDKAADRLSQVSLKEEKDAQYYAAAKGIGLPSASLLKRLEMAQQETNSKISDAAIEESIQEGVWKREDAKTLHELAIRNWSLKPELEEKTWYNKESLDLEAYKAFVSYANGYGAITDALATKYRAQIEWVLGYLDAENSRYQAQLEAMKTNIASEAERRGWSEMQLRDLLEQADKATGYAIEKAKAILENTYRAEEAVAQLMVGITQAALSAADYGLSGQGTQSVSENIAS